LRHETNTINKNKEEVGWPQVIPLYFSL
jgi:hypothetical protein